MTEGYSIEIISVDQSKPLDMEYNTAASWRDASSNGNQFANLGAILRDADGQVLRDGIMTVTATDETQNRELVNTGNYLGVPQNSYYFPFVYLFKTAGEHEISFACNGATASVTLKAI